jgi:hypothetical protein
LVKYKRIAYTSLAALDLTEQQLRDIHAAARDLNGIDGVSGLLLFNGTHFLQWIEGPPQAIDELVERLRRDPRHSAFEIREESHSDERLFGDWSMELVRVKGRVLSSREDLFDLLPAELPPAVRDRIAAMAEQVSADVEL